eukprot:g17850.t1
MHTPAAKSIMQKLEESLQKQEEALEELEKKQEEKEQGHSIPKEVAWSDSSLLRQIFPLRLMMALVVMFIYVTRYYQFKCKWSDCGGDMYLPERATYSMGDFVLNGLYHTIPHQEKPFWTMPDVLLEALGPSAGKTEDRLPPVLAGDFCQERVELHRAKWDVLASDVDPEKRKNLCRALRHFALVHGAHLVLTSLKEKTSMNAMRGLLRQLLFCVPPKGSLEQLDHSKPICVTAGKDIGWRDSVSAIGLPNSGQASERAWKEYEVSSDELTLLRRPEEQAKWLAQLAEAGSSGDLSKAPDEIRQDREVLLAAVSADDDALQWASTDLQGDRAVVLAAVRRCGFALACAAGTLQDRRIGGLGADRSLVLAAVQRHGLALEFADTWLRADEEVVLTALEQDGNAFQFADVRLRSDRTFVLRAVRCNGYALTYAQPELRNDREIALQADRELVLAAVQQDGAALAFASEELREEKEVVLQAVHQTGSALAFAAPALKADREVVWAAVQESGLALEHAADELRDDEDLVFVAVATGAALRFASPRLRAQRRMVCQALRADEAALAWASEELQSDRKLQKFARRCGQVVEELFKYPESSIDGMVEQRVEELQQYRRQALRNQRLASEGIEQSKAIMLPTFNKEMKAMQKTLGWGLQHEHGRIHHHSPVRASTRDVHQRITEIKAQLEEKERRLQEVEEFYDMRKLEVTKKIAREDDKVAMLERRVGLYKNSQKFRNNKRCEFLQFVEKPWFDGVVALVILLNLLMVAMELLSNGDKDRDFFWWDTWRRTWRQMGALLCGAFEHVWPYWIDLFIVVAGSGELLLGLLELKTRMGVWASILQAFRVVRVVKLVRLLKDTTWAEESPFQFFIMGVILCNAVLIGAQMNHGDLEILTTHGEDQL